MVKIEGGKVTLSKLRVPKSTMQEEDIQPSFQQSWDKKGTPLSISSSPKKYNICSNT